MNSFIELAWAMQHRIEDYFKYNHKQRLFSIYQYSLFFPIIITTLSGVRDLMEFILLINTLCIMGFIFFYLTFRDLDILFYKD